MSLLTESLPTDYIYLILGQAAQNHNSPGSVYYFLLDEISVPIYAGNRTIVLDFLSNPTLLPR